MVKKQLISFHSIVGFDKHMVQFQHRTFFATILPQVQNLAHGVTAQTKIAGIHDTSTATIIISAPRPNPP